MTPAQITAHTLEISRLHEQSHLAWQRAHVCRFGLPMSLATAEGKEDRWNPAFSPESWAREIMKRNKKQKESRQ